MLSTISSYLVIVITVLVLKHFINHSSSKTQKTDGYVNFQLLMWWIIRILCRLYFCIFYWKLEGILKYFKRFVISIKIPHLCMPQILIVNLWKVALQLEFQFAPCTTRNFHSTSPVSLSPNCISISRFQCTVGTDVIQGHVHTGDRRARYTQLWTRGHI